MNIPQAVLNWISPVYSGLATYCATGSILPNKSLRVVSGIFSGVVQHSVTTQIVRQAREQAESVCSYKILNSTLTAGIVGIGAGIGIYYVLNKISRMRFID